MSSRLRIKNRCNDINSEKEIDGIISSGTVHYQKEKEHHFSLVDCAQTFHKIYKQTVLSIISMKNSHLIGIIIVLSFLLVLAGCGGKKTISSPVTATPKEEVMSQSCLQKVCRMQAPI